MMDLPFYAVGIYKFSVKLNDFRSINPYFKEWIALELQSVQKITLLAGRQQTKCTV